MKVLKFEGKDEQVALEKALSELSVNENQVIYKGLFSYSYLSTSHST